jgi:N-acetylglutamate synthase/N-acetylornithine aminotransferase
VRVSTLGIAAGRPLPARDEGITALLLTDATFGTGALARFAAELAERSFAQLAGVHAPHRDDAIVVVATGAAGTTPLTLDALGGRTLLVGAVAVAQSLVQQLLEHSDPADAGFTAGPALVVQITVSGARDVEQAAAVAEAIAVERPAPEALADAVARIAAGAGVRVERLKLFADWKRNAARAALRVDLGLAQASATRWTAFA